MKRVLLSLSMLAFTAATMTILSCNKIKDEIAKQIDPFNFNHQNINLTVPVITSTLTYTSSGIDTADINLDAIIKENAGNNFGINNVESLIIEKVTVSILNHDAANNLSNFDTAKIYINSDQGITNKKNDIFVGAWVNATTYDAANQSLTITGDPKLQMMDYLKGTKVYYWFRVRAKKATTKPLDLNIKIDYKLQPKL